MMLYSYYRKAWIKLGEMSREEAQKELVRLLHSVAPQLKDYALEQWGIQKPEVERGKRCVTCNLFVTNKAR